MIGIDKRVEININLETFIPDIKKAYEVNSSLEILPFFKRL